MLDRATRWFLRWRDRGDAAALARVFDRTAPELLRLGLNLSHSIADAEDLVQATFVSAIESATRFDGSRRVTPWLVAILTNHAHAERRRRQRAAAGGEPDALPTAAPGPGDAASARELAQHGRAALEALPEPYRQPTLLRVAHGLPPAEIALLLGRSPGTVRAQIHRGLEQLRRRLPASAFAALLPTADLVGRGLSSLKAHVLAHAAMRAPVAAATSTLAATTLAGTILMSKKTLAASLLLLAGLTWAIVRGGADPGLALDPPETTALAAQTGHAAAAHEDSAPREPVAEAARTVAPYDPGPDAIHYRAKVVDGRNQQAIAGVTIAVFAPRRTTMLAVQREFGAFGQPLPSGLMTSTVEWLRAAPMLSPEQIARGEAGNHLLPPTPEQTPMHRTHTDSAGTFALELPRSGSMLALERDGYGTRWVPIQRGQPDAITPPLDEGEATFVLWPTAACFGTVRQLDGTVPPEPIDLVLIESSATFPATGAWRTRTADDGSFRCAVAAERVLASSRTPGWIVAQITRGESGLPTQVSPFLEVGVASTIYVERFGSARVHVTDAETGRPIEMLQIVAQDEHEMTRLSGTFWAEDGWFSLGGFPAEDIATQRAIGLDSGFPKQLRARIASPGYRSQRTDDVTLYAAEPPVVEVALTRGEPDRAIGHVVRGGEPVADALVTLRLFRRIDWQRHDASLAAAATSDPAGAFALSAPAGDYLLEVAVAGEQVAQQVVAVPAKDLAIDLADSVHVTVEVADADGEPLADHPCSVTDGSGNRRVARTDQDGRARLGPFAAGTLNASAPRTAAAASWTAAVTVSTIAARGAQPLLQLRLPRDTTHRARLVFDGAAPTGWFHGFTALDVSIGESGSPVDVEEDGLVPIDLRAGATLWLGGPGGRQWQFVLPKQLSTAPTLLLRWSGAGYRGQLTDTDGRPIAHGRVFATPSVDAPTLAATTDDDGRFALDGLEVAPYRLNVHGDASARSPSTSNNRLATAWFHPTALPSTPPAELQLRVPRAAAAADDEALLAVTVRVQAADGTPATARVNVTTLFDDRDGQLELFPTKMWQSTDSAGCVQLRVARGTRYRVSVVRPGAARQTEEWTVPAAATHCERTVVLR